MEVGPAAPCTTPPLPARGSRWLALWKGLGAAPEGETPNSSGSGFGPKLGREKRRVPKPTAEFCLSLETPDLGPIGSYVAADPITRC